MTAPTTPTGTLTDGGLAAFTEYFVKNYPGPHTVIGNPEWHAPKIFRAAQYAITAAGLAHPQGQGEPDEVLADALAVIGEKIQHADGFDPHLLHIMVPVDVLRVLYAAQGQVSASVPQFEPTEYCDLCGMHKTATVCTLDDCPHAASIPTAVGKQPKVTTPRETIVQPGFIAPAPIPPAGTVAEPRRCHECGSYLPAPPHAGQEPDALVQRLRAAFADLPIQEPDGSVSEAGLRDAAYTHGQLWANAADRIEADATRIAELTTENSRVWQQGYDAKAAAVTNADYSWKPRAETAEAALAQAVALLREVSSTQAIPTPLYKRITVFLASAKADERSDGQGAG